MNLFRALTPFFSHEITQEIIPMTPYMTSNSWFNLSIWQKIASHSSYCQISQICKRSNEAITKELEVVKEIYDQFVNLQESFIYKGRCSDPVPSRCCQRIFNGNFYLKGFEMKSSCFADGNAGCVIGVEFRKMKETLLQEENKNERFMSYYFSPALSNLVYEIERPIKQIHVYRNDYLTNEQHWTLLKAEKYANLAFKERRNAEKDTVYNYLFT